MKKTTIILFIFAFFAISSGISRNVYSQNENSIVIPLQVGENPPVQFETLQIGRILLLYNEVPSSEHLPNIRLMLWSRIGDIDFGRTEISYHYDERWAHRNNRLSLTFLSEFGNYAIRMKINESNISLEIEKFELEFGKAFTLRGRQQTAVIGNLSIRLTNMLHATDVDFGGVASFEITLSKNEEQKEFWFGCRRPNEDVRILEWKNYQIAVLEASPQMKLKVTKKSNE